jgi:hypothetical protein
MEEIMEGNNSTKGIKGGGDRRHSPVVFDGSSFHSVHFFAYLCAELESQRPITEPVQIKKKNNTITTNGNTRTPQKHTHKRKEKDK